MFLGKAMFDSSWIAQGIASLVEQQALPLDAVYFLAPTLENMDRLVEEGRAHETVVIVASVKAAHRVFLSQ